MTLSDLTIIIPCYNEEAALPRVLPELIDFCREHLCSLIVVNDGSRDRSRDILEEFKTDCLTVLSHKLNRGYGAAIKTGVAAARTKYVITVDADGQHNPDDILKLYQKALDSDADMIVGGRPPSTDASKYRALGKFLIRAFITFLMKINIRDINSGMKLYSRALAERFLPFCPDGMAYSDTILLFFLQYRCLVLEEPITIRPRQDGQSIINTMTAMQTIYELLLAVILFFPFKFFSMLSAGIGLLALIWSLRCYLMSNIISAGSSLLWMLAVITLFLGIITEQICRFRRQQIRIWEYHG